ncbi:dipeptidase [Polymorphobacter sp. PAMC 29334]|uniref:dipeptidase n=1 Tax=Polymorphobacter sp. PAMC 29334 TaxID=2862331 RepID=UPI001C66A18A|nr:membrane dipeptidase [Polymorphobacter sp. PAMC 29334]QYE33823.1 dipeptidase [Polymorphobacter sp. PAMC 29334]
MIDRRTFVAIGIAGLAEPALSHPRANTADLYNRAVVIDGNLVPPIEGVGALSAEAVIAIQSSGLTAVKADVDGSDTFDGANEMIRDFRSAIASNGALLAQIQEVADIRRCKELGKLGIIFSFENVGQLDGKVASIDHFRALGVRVMQLSYNQASVFASGAMTPAVSSTGLTELGRSAVDRMNKLGVTIDLSHSDARTTMDVLAASRSSPIISHAGCAAVNPHPRNKPDELLRGVAEKGGVVGIYDLPFLAPLDRQPTVTDYIVHLLHALNVCGEDHVGIGSDAMFAGFDTSPENMRGYLHVVADRKARGIGAPGEERPPFVIGMNTSRRAEVIADALTAKGISARVIEKILGSNWVAAFERSWMPA